VCGGVWWQCVLAMHASGSGCHGTMHATPCQARAADVRCIRASTSMHALGRVAPARCGGPRASVHAPSRRDQTPAAHRARPASPACSRPCRPPCAAARARRRSPTQTGQPARPRHPHPTSVCCVVRQVRVERACACGWACVRCAGGVASGSERSLRVLPLAPLLCAAHLLLLATTPPPPTPATHTQRHRHTPHTTHRTPHTAHLDKRDVAAERGVLEHAAAVDAACHGRGVAVVHLHLLRTRGAPHHLGGCGSGCCGCGCGGLSPLGERFATWRWGPTLCGCRQRTRPAVCAARALQHPGHVPCDPLCLLHTAAWCLQRRATRAPRPCDAAAAAGACAARARVCLLSAADRSCLLLKTLLLHPEHTGDEMRPRITPVE
jgi:hypothetical protein